jgi:catechol 2,3-dioxygenase-like lactoylglutathione lyase family enzyme
MDDADQQGPHPGRGTIQRMDNIAIVVDDLAAAKAFFVELGLELEGEATVEGTAVDRLVRLEGVRSDIAVMRTPGRPRTARADQVPHAIEPRLASRSPTPVTPLRPQSQGSR